MDQEAIEKKYREERDKRLRSESFRYVDIESDYARFVADPLQEEVRPRPASNDAVDVVVVGAGISGLMTAVELRRAGVDNFRVIDSAADFGGTWYWNRYPGLRCDCESYIYMPYLEETGHVPSQKYAPGREIQGHLRSLAERYELYDNALLQTRVTEVRWSADTARWIVRTDRGDEFAARHIVLGSGPLNRPKLPAVPGIDEFEGVQFHSSRWDYGFTGGDRDGELTNLRDKRVAVVGTGTSAVQIVPAVAKAAEHLYVVQRTPSIVDSRGNAPTDREWFASQEPGWQDRRMENFDGILVGMPVEKDLVGDMWTTIWGGFNEAASAGSIDEIRARLAADDLQQLERIRSRVDELVDDPATAEALKPYYGRFCKRPAFSDEYLPTFNRPNVSLIDTQGRGMDRITRNGIVFDGEEYPVDLIVYATGFEFGAVATRSGGFEVYGPDGSTLTEVRAKAADSLHGIQFHGFPNLFVIGGLHQAAVSINIPFTFGMQARHVARLVKDFTDRGVVVAEPRAEAVGAWGELIASRSSYDIEYSRNCTPGWYNNEGTYEAGKPNVFYSAYGGGPLEYGKVLEEWRAGSVDQDLELRFEQGAAAEGAR